MHFYLEKDWHRRLLGLHRFMILPNLKKYVFDFLLNLENGLFVIVYDYYFQDACNMVAKAGCGGGMPPVTSIFCNSGNADGVLVPHQPDQSVYEPWDMSDREKYLSTKCIRLIQGTYNANFHGIFQY